MNVLIVDDDLALLRSLEIVLSEHGHHVMSFCDPESARLYINSDADIDVLLVDYVMGEMKGDDLLARIGRDKATRWTTIMITGHKEQIASSKLLQALGVRHLLCKPLDLDQLCELVES